MRKKIGNKSYETLVLNFSYSKVYGKLKEILIKTTTFLIFFVMDKVRLMIVKNLELMLLILLKQDQLELLIFLNI